MTPDGRQIAVANYLGGTLDIIDLSQGEVTRTVNFDAPGDGDNPGPVYLMSSSDGLLVALIGSDRIALLDTSTWERLETIDTYGEVDGMDFSSVHTSVNSGS